MTSRLPWPLLAGLVLATRAIAAEPMGRLFLAPEQRAALERQRQAKVPDGGQAVTASVVRLDGIVTRSGGKNTVWLNQRPQGEGNAGTGILATTSPGNSGRALVTADEEAPASLKVGEAIHRGGRGKIDGLGGGRITVAR